MNKALISIILLLSLMVIAGGCIEKEYSGLYVEDITIDDWTISQEYNGTGIYKTKVVEARVKKCHDCCDREIHIGKIVDKRKTGNLLDEPRYDIVFEDGVTISVIHIEYHSYKHNGINKIIRKGRIVTNITWI